MCSARHEEHVDYEAEALEAFDKATRLYRLCPNRVWATAQSLLGKEGNLRLLFPLNDGEIDRVFLDPRNYEVFEDDNHSRCNYKFCERSQMNSTSVPQRHESASCSRQQCGPIMGRFEKWWLDVSVNRGRSTAWHLNGSCVISDNSSYMAVSHVWSDGTGVGAWANGQINKCLYGFFASIARQFGCEGIWWDTICIPGEKKARAKAISSMHENYENAEVTLIHDCFLRDLEWIDAESACLAIVMSPWFSRGWTALELAKSRTVKVLFKKERRIIVKDLDEDILRSRTPRSERHKVLANAIGQLRDERITDLNRLLKVLGPRHTSWSRDMAIIAGLLVDVPVEPAIGSSNEMYQQDIYQNILRNFRTIKHGHLFHNSPMTFNDASWCPTSIFDMPMTSTQEGSDGRLEVRSNGDLVGMWYTVSLRSIPRECYVWKDVHPLIEPRLRSALRQESDHMFLVEPGSSSFNTALIVKKRHGAVQLIGYMYFHPPQKIQPIEQERIIRILHTEVGEVSQVIEHQEYDPDVVANTELMSLGEGFYHDDTPGKTSDSLLENSDVAARRFQQLSIDNRPQCYPNNPIMQEICRRIQAGADLSSQDSSGGTLLSRAAEQGNEEATDFILLQYEQPLVMKGSNVPHTSVPTLTPDELLEALESKDSQHMTALSWAAQAGHAGIVRKLILWAEVDINSTSRPADVSRLPLPPTGRQLRGDLATPLFLAAENGHETVVKMLLDAGAHLSGWKNTELPLLVASANGHLATVSRLLRAGAKIDVEGTLNNRSPRNALYLATENGYEKVVELLLTKGANVNYSRETNLTSLTKVARRNGHVKVVEAILNAVVVSHGSLISELHGASSDGHFEIVELLWRKGIDINSRDSSGASPLQAAAMHNWMGDIAWETYQQPWLSSLPPKLAEEARRRKKQNSFKTVQVLLDKHAEVNAQGGYFGNALQAASAGGHIDIVKLLISCGADVKAKGGHYGTAIKAAEKCGYKEVVKVLKSKKTTSK